MVSAVIFDLFGVVGQELGHTWITSQGLEEKRERLDREYFLAGDLNRIREEDYWPGIAAIAGTTASAVKDEWYSRIGEMPGMFALIAELRPHKRIALCTNAAPWLFEEVDRRIGLRGRFDEIITSYEERVAKPDSEIYRITLERIGQPAKEAIFVDDRAVNVAAAEALGMKGILFKDAASLREELAELGVV